MTGIINGKVLRRQLAAARARGETDWGVDEATFQFWKANAGNAKARRRWRRRNVPNTQRPTSNMAAQCMAAWASADGAKEKVVSEWQDAMRYMTEALDAKSEHFGTWDNGATWAPGIWAGSVNVASFGESGPPTMRVAKVDTKARTITIEALP